MSYTHKSNRAACETALQKAVYDGMRNLASAIVKEAQDNANQIPPAHPQVQTGHMRNSITMDVEKRGSKVEGKVGLIKGAVESSEVLVYGPVIELGRKDGTIPPYPYLYPAAKAFVGKAAKYFRRAKAL